MNISAINTIVNNFKNVTFKSNSYKQPARDALYDVEGSRDIFERRKKTEIGKEFYPNGKIKKLTYIRDDASIVTVEYNKKGMNIKKRIESQDGTITTFEYYSNGVFKSDEVQKDGITTRKDYYNYCKGTKQLTEQYPSGYTRIIKYYPKTGEPKEYTIISANGICQETVEYDKEGIPKKAYRQWSNGIRTKLPKDFDIIG